MPAEVLRSLSRRRAEIEEELERLGAAGRTAAQVAALATRRSKDYDVTPETLMPTWRARAEGMTDFLVVNRAHPFLMWDARVQAAIFSFLEAGRFDR